MYKRQEFYYLASGEVTYFVEDAVYTVKRGDVILIPPQTIHKTMPREVQRHKRILIYLTPAFIAEFLRYNPNLLDCFRTTQLIPVSYTHLDVYKRQPYGGTEDNIPYELRGIPNTTGGWLARDYIEVKDGAVKLVRECAEKVFDGTEMWGRTTDAHTPADVNNFYTNSLDGGAAIKWACNPMSDRLISCPYGTVPEANMFICCLLYTSRCV